MEWIMSVCQKCMHTMVTLFPTQRLRKICLFSNACFFSGLLSDILCCLFFNVVNYAETLQVNEKTSPYKQLNGCFIYHPF